MPLHNAHIYLPTPDDMVKIRTGSFKLVEPAAEKTEVKSALANFEYCLNLLKTRAESQEVLLAEITSLLAEFNVKKSLATVINQVINLKSLEYENQVLNPKTNSIILKQDPLRLNIGHVTRGGFIQSTGCGGAFAILVQPQEVEFDVFKVLKQQKEKTDIVVLYRNPTDVEYKVAKVKPLIN